MWLKLPLPLSTSKVRATGTSSCSCGRLASTMACIVDMRSDTVTKPTKAMKEVMVNAELGDDVFGDDPTVIELEKLCAELFKKPAGLFVPSGTMSNLIGVMTHCSERGSEVILGNQNHLVIYEQGGMATVGGIHPRQLRTVTEAGEPTPIGGIALSELEQAIRPLDDHFPVTRLVCLENSHNLCGGTALPLEYIDAVGQLCAQHKVKLHMDGARIFNAAAAVNQPVDRLCLACDSISVCLSKGLAAPVGSVLLGDEEFIRKARRQRKALGGGMRQAGVLAACGIESLRTMTGRLHEDHARAMTLAKALAEMPQVSVNLPSVQTNIVYFQLPRGGGKRVVEELAKRHVRITAKDDYTCRAVTHYEIDDAGLQVAIAALREVIQAVCT